MCINEYNHLYWICICPDYLAWFNAEYVQYAQYSASV